MVHASVDEWECRHYIGGRAAKWRTRIKLPNAQLAVVERRKVEEYLLNPNHPLGASKERFFTAFGFRRDSWELLAEALANHGRTYEVVRHRETGFGPRFVVEGPLNAADGRTPTIQTVWQIEAGEVAPRLITAYPSEP